MKWLHRLLGIECLQDSINFLIDRYQKEECDDEYNESTTNERLNHIDERLADLIIQEKGYRNKFEDLNENTKKLNLMILECKGLVARVRGEVAKKDSNL